MSKACPIVWHDELTSDVEAAKTFYAAVLGWTYQLQKPDYHITLAQDHAMGGILPAPEYLHLMPPFWSCYIETPNIDRACKRVEQMGGTIFRVPWDVPGGRIAVIADPTGAPFNILQSLPGHEDVPPPQGTLGAVGWNELHAGNLDDAWDFYAGMFGWTKGTALDMGKMGTYQLFQVNGKDAGAIMKKQAMLPRPMWLFYFVVDGINNAIDRITRAGGKIAMGPHQAPGGNWIVSAFDPQGGNFQLTSATA
jgi:uncharacterized protein